MLKEQDRACEPSGTLLGVPYPVAPKLDIDKVIASISSVGGPEIAPVRPLSGGSVGAWAVRRPNGAISVLTWRPPTAGTDASSAANRVADLVSIARASGVPAPAYEDVVALPGGGVVVLQEFIEGQRPVPARRLITDLLVLSEHRRSALRGTDHSAQPASLYLTGDGPSYCLHGPLRDHSRPTRRLIDWIETIGQSDGDVLPGDDLVHFDYHPGNMLAAPDDPSRIVAILDWDTASNGDVAIDAVNLALDLVLYGTDASLVDQIVDHLYQTTPDSVLRRCWAHGLLRLVDWRIRHSPSDDLSWLPRAEALVNI